MSNPTVCIVGLGLLGGSYAMGLAKAGWRVTAIDVREEALAYAVQHGLIAEGKTEQFEDLLAEADVLVLGLYPKAILTWLQAHQDKLRPGCIITDVCGVKSGLVEEVQSFLRTDVEFIACHPMAGREVSGVEHANDAIFKGANFIITPTAKNSGEALAFAQQLAQTLGFGHISILTCAQHDQMIGYVSQLTHAIAVSLMNANDNESLANYTGDSFRDLTRIARINENLWSELFLANREVLADEIDQFTDTLQGLKQKLLDGDEEGLKDLFRKSTARRMWFDKK